METIIEPQKQPTILIEPQPEKPKTRIWLIAVIILLGLVVGGLLYAWLQLALNPRMTSYEECLAEGNVNIFITGGACQNQKGEMFYGEREQDTQTQLPASQLPPNTPPINLQVPFVLENILSLSQAANWNTPRYITDSETTKLFEIFPDTLAGGEYKSAIGKLSGIYVISKESNLKLSTVEDLSSNGAVWDPASSTVGANISKVLLAEGWTQSNIIASDGVFGSRWAYEKQVGDKKQLLLFAWTSPDSGQPPQELAPGSTKPPTIYTNEVFLSDPY